jgi:hypothetical protein
MRRLDAGSLTSLEKSKKAERFERATGLTMVGMDPAFDRAHHHLRIA